MKSPIKDKKIFAKIKKIGSIHLDTYYNEYPTQEELVEGNLVKKGDSRHYNLEIEVYSPRRYSFLRRRNPLSIFFPGSSTDSIALVFTLSVGFNYFPANWCAAWIFSEFYFEENRS
ncbi:TPA: hypothetical protein EYO63_23590 [Candidatus Poribacteria bacterium]|nr:hypothetical protein [Candidatus Poribacteria bacterium]